MRYIAVTWHGESRTLHILVDTETEEPTMFKSRNEMIHWRDLLNKTDEAWRQEGVRKL